MAIVVSFEKYTPPPRFDGLPYTQVRIGEAASPDGPFTLIDTQVLAPVEPDPANPLARSFTTHLGTLAEGWYQISFVDAAAHVVPTDPIQNLVLAQHPFVPSLSAIGQVIMSRTKDTFGNLNGTFTSGTTPDNLQAAAAAANAAKDLSMLIGDVVPESLIDDAQRVAAIKAAMDIEVAFYSDQVNTGRSVYPQLEKRYEAELASLTKQMTMVTEGGVAVVEEGPSLRPSWNFTDPPGQDSWLTRRM